MNCHSTLALKNNKIAVSPVLSIEKWICVEKRIFKSTGKKKKTESNQIAVSPSLSIQNMQETRAIFHIDSTQNEIIQPFSSISCPPVTLYLRAEKFTTCTQHEIYSHFCHGLCARVALYLRGESTHRVHIHNIYTTWNIQPFLSQIMRTCHPVLERGEIHNIHTTWNIQPFLSWIMRTCHPVLERQETLAQILGFRIRIDVVLFGDLHPSFRSCCSSWSLSARVQNKTVYMSTMNLEV